MTVYASLLENDIYSQQVIKHTVLAQVETVKEG